MRMSNLFGRTLRENPADAELPSHALLVRAGMIRALAAGVYSYLPLGWRVIHKIEQIIREDMAGTRALPGSWRARYGTGYDA
jgi:prolyl-tRNA synthetase